MTNAEPTNNNLLNENNYRWWIVAEFQRKWITLIRPPIFDIKSGGASISILINLVEKPEANCYRYDFRTNFQSKTDDCLSFSIRAHIRRWCFVSTIVISPVQSTPHAIKTNCECRRLIKSELQFVHLLHHQNGELTHSVIHGKRDKRQFSK